MTESNHSPKVQIYRIKHKSEIISDMAGVNRIKWGNNWNRPGLNKVVFWALGMEDS